MSDNQEPNLIYDLANNIIKSASDHIRETHLDLFFKEINKAFNNKSEHLLIEAFQLAQKERNPELANIIEGGILYKINHDDYIDPNTYNHFKSDLLIIPFLARPKKNMNRVRFPNLTIIENQINQICKDEELIPITSTFNLSSLMVNFDKTRKFNDIDWYKIHQYILKNLNNRHKSAAFHKSFNLKLPDDGGSNLFFLFSNITQEVNGDNYSKPIIIEDFQHAHSHKNKLSNKLTEFISESYKNDINFLLPFSYGIGYLNSAKQFSYRKIDEFIHKYESSDNDFAIIPIDGMNSFCLLAWNPKINRVNDCLHIENSNSTINENIDTTLDYISMTDKKVHLCKTTVPSLLINTYRSFNFGDFVKEYGAESLVADDDY